MEVRTRAPSTARGYAEDWSRFQVWCTFMGVASLPADPVSVAFYLAHLAPVWRPAGATDPPEAVVGNEVCQRPGLSPASLVRHLAAISARHRDAGWSTPTRDTRVQDTLARIRRRVDTPAPQRIALAVPERLRVMVAGLDVGHDPAAARDAALLLIGYTVALRRGEVAALTLGQIVHDPDGAWIDVASSPVDRARSTTTRIGATGETGCPVQAWDRWRSWLADRDPGTALDPGAPAFRAIRKGAVVAGEGARAAACLRIGDDALTDRSVARIGAHRARTS